MDTTCRMLLIPGSLRRRSTNMAVLRTARAVAPEGSATFLFEGLATLPPFNPDADIEPLPGAVAGLRGQIREADALLFSTPEYAGGLPGAFKNLLDWTVGDDQAGSVYRKPVAWINASPRGAPNAHESLRRVLGYVKADIIEAACVHIPVTEALITDDGLLSDLTFRRQISDGLTELAARAMGPGGEGAQPR
ncbi:MAG TPA: NADPH-dependent FMN reductase [Acidimicrobiales bacterium]